MKKLFYILAFLCLLTQSCKKENNTLDLLPGRWHGSYEVELDYVDQIGRRTKYEHDLTITYLSASKGYDAEVKPSGNWPMYSFEFRVDKNNTIIVEGDKDASRYNGAIIKRLDEKNLVLELATYEHDVIVPLIMEMRRQ